MCAPSTFFTSYPLQWDRLTYTSLSISVSGSVSACVCFNIWKENKIELEGRIRQFKHMIEIVIGHRNIKCLGNNDTKLVGEETTYPTSFLQQHPGPTDRLVSPCEQRYFKLENGPITEGYNITPYILRVSAWT